MHQNASSDLGDKSGRLLGTKLHGANQLGRKTRRPDARLSTGQVRESSPGSCLLDLLLHRQGPPRSALRRSAEILPSGSFEDHQSSWLGPRENLPLECIHERGKTIKLNIKFFVTDDTDS